jgi:hypothetical protein
VARLRRALVVAGCGLAMLTSADVAPAQEAATVDATLTPRAILFGDALAARVDVRVNPELADPATVELSTHVEPFEVEGMRRVSDVGSDPALVRFELSLRCLTQGCLPPASGAGRRVDMRPLEVRFQGDDGEHVVEAPLPSVRVGSRLNQTKASGDRGWSYDDRTLAPPSYALSPEFVTVALWALAALLGVLAAGLIGYAMIGRTPYGALLAARRGSPLDRALRLVHRAARRGPQERRKALERLARELRRAGQAELAERTGTLAWSRPEPQRGEMGALVGEVERTVQASA